MYVQLRGATGVQESHEVQPSRVVNLCIFREFHTIAVLFAEVRGEHRSEDSRPKGEDYAMRGPFLTGETERDVREGIVIEKLS